MTQVWQRLNCSGGELLLALALADIADDDGDRIYPSVATLADKTRQSERQVQRQLKRFRTRHWLQMKKVSKGRHPNRYRINPVWINGDILSGFEDKQPRHLEQSTVTSETSNPDKLSHPIHPRSTIEPLSARKTRSVSRSQDEDKKQKRIREAIHDLRLTSYGRNPKAIAAAAGCSVAEAERELGTLQ